MDEDINAQSSPRKGTRRKHRHSKTFPTNERQTETLKLGPVTGHKEDTLVPYDNEGYSPRPMVKCPEQAVTVEPLSGMRTLSRRKSMFSGPDNDDFDTELRMVGGTENATSKYISETFVHRRCKKYVEDKDNKCKCGYDKAAHTTKAKRMAKEIEGERWAPETHTETIAPNTYGEIDFYGFGRELTIPAPYVRIDHETDNESIWKLLTEYWHLPVPNLIISVTGGNKNFQLKKRMLESVKRGLIKAAASTGAWIVTTGMNSGVVKYVGEAVKDHVITTSTAELNIVCLGICPWGYIDNKETLISKNPGQGMSPAEYNIKDCVPHAKINLKKKAPLDPNHTHFLMVDNGTNEVYGVEKYVRANLEQYVATKMETNVGENQTINVPIVRLVLEGGLNTLESTAEAIRNKIPVVVFQGSGRSADIIAYCYNITRSKTNEDLTVYNESIEEILEEKVVQFLELTKVEPTRDNIAESKGWVKNCLEDRRLLSVYELGDADQDEAIEKAILNALLKVNKHNASTQLSLALSWDRCDIARHEIFTPEKRELWKDIPISDYFFIALVENRADFVQLLLDVGVELKKSLTVQRLRDLYDRSLLEKNSSTYVLKTLLKKAESSLKKNGCGHGRCYSSDVSPDQFDILLPACGKVISDLVGFQCPNFYGACGEYFEHPERELFLWAIMLNRKELASLFWRSGKDHIGTALVGSSLLKSLMSVAQSVEEIDYYNTLNELARDFEERAIGVTTECYNKDTKMSQLVLTRQLCVWGNTTSLNVAAVAEHMDFMACSAPQTLLNKIWKGNMALFTPSWLIFLAAFIPLFIPLIKFSKKDAAISKLRNMQHSGFKGPSKGTEKNEKRGHIDERNNLSVYSMHLRSDPDSDHVSLWEAIKYFYTAPITKFIHTTVAYLVFLGLFSYYVLTDLHPIGTANSPSIVEAIVWAWAIILMLEEARQVFSNDTRTTTYNIKDWFSNTWNRFDLIMYILLLLSVVLRCSLMVDQFHHARGCYALTLAMFYMRFIQLFYVHPKIGPKVIMIEKMIMDLLFFIVLVIVFILSYGVATQALLYPNAKAEWILVKNVLYAPYWQIFSDVDLGLAEGNAPDSVTCSHDRSIWYSDPNTVQCPETNWMVPIFLIIYILLTNVLLLNLLIAMFSYTFQMVQENAELVWRFNRFALIFEYYDRPELAPPFSFVLVIYRLIRYTVSRFNMSAPPSTDFREVLNADEDLKITAFVKYCMERYLVSEKKRTSEQLESKVTDTGDTVCEVKRNIEEIREHMVDDTLKEDTNKPVDHQNELALLNDQLKSLNDHVNRKLMFQELQLSTMMDILKKLAKTDETEKITAVDVATYYMP
ncbi:transient receptor potential cation channel subfamily M member-like 2 [Lineus longissimus]|uniref:transient receptor potential cation channel subfamily M member-like 2 n=1 Tax=Lineus longissimus TaxID=88925 RepID=UPI00315CAE8D